MKEVDNIRCNDCKFRNNGCKRIDHDTVKFAIPFFQML